MYEKTTGVPKAFANIQGGGHTESDGFDKRRMTEYAIAMMDCHLRTLAILAQALKHFVPLQICKSTLERTYKRQILFDQGCKSWEIRGIPRNTTLQY